MENTSNLFKCKFKLSNGYCKNWLRFCVGANNCKQGNCSCCEYSSISPKIENSICVKCSQFNFKKENYIE